LKEYCIPKEEEEEEEEEENNISWNKILTTCVGISFWCHVSYIISDWNVKQHIVVEFTNIYAISAYHH
jgi:hypothetical protein